MGAGAPVEAGDMTANNVRVSGEGVIGFVDGVAVDDDRSATDARLGVDDSVSANDVDVALHAAGHGEIAEEHEDVARKVTVDLY